MTIRTHLASLAVSLAAATMALAPPALAAAPKRPKVEAPGELSVQSLTNGATIEVDGKVVGSVPLDDGLVLLPGKHTIRMTKRGYAEYKDSFDVKPGQPVELEIDLLPFAGVVTIKTTDPGATVKVDGKVEGVTPFDQDIPAGKRVITISREGFYDEVRELDIHGGEPYDLSIALRPMPKVEAGGQAFYETWWFWTIVGVAGAGAAAAAIASSSGGGTVTPTANYTLNVP